MVNEELINYIKTEILKNTPLGKIKKNLLKKKWALKEINEALDFIVQKEVSTNVSEEIKEKQIIKKSSKFLGAYIFFTVVIILIIFTFFIFNKGNLQAVESNHLFNMTNCINDMDCFVEASNTCTPAKVNHTSTINIFGLLITTTNIYEIKKAENKTCQLYLKIENQKIDYHEDLIKEMLKNGISESQIIKQKKETNKYSELLIGKDGICEFKDNKDLKRLLINRKNGDINGTVSCNLVNEKWNCTNTGDWEPANCEGNLFLMEATKQ